MTRWRRRARKERTRIEKALLLKLAAAGSDKTVGDVVSETLREMYGDDVPPEARDVALDLVDELLARSARSGSLASSGESAEPLMTVGDAFDQGKLSESAEYYEESLGPDWRQMDIRTAKEQFVKMRTHAARDVDELRAKVATEEEKIRIMEALLDNLEHVGSGRTVGDVITETLRQMYGDDVPAEAWEVARELVAEYQKTSATHEVDEAQEKVVSTEERARIEKALLWKIASGAAGQTVGDLVTGTLRELYGEDIPPEAWDVAREVVDELVRSTQGA